MTAFKTKKNIIAFIGLIAFLASCKPSPPPGMTDPGQIIYLGYKDTFASCKRCHGEDGQGTQQGPDIRNSVGDLGRKEIQKLIVFGKESDDYKENMPALGEDLTPEEIAQVIDFISHWGKPDSTAADGSQ